MTFRRRKVNQALTTQMGQWTDKPTTLIEADRTTEGAGLPSLFPYLLIEPLGSGDFDDSDFVLAWTDVALSYQLVSVGQTIDQAEWMADKARECFLDFRTYPLVLDDGWSPVGRFPDGGPDQPEKVTENFWQVRESVRLRIARG